MNYFIRRLIICSKSQKTNQNAVGVIFNGVVLLQEGLNVFQILVLKISFVSFDTFGLLIITRGSYSILKYFWGNKTKEGEGERAIEREEEREGEKESNRDRKRGREKERDDFSSLVLLNGSLYPSMLLN